MVKMNCSILREKNSELRNTAESKIKEFLSFQNCIEPHEELRGFWCIFSRKGRNFDFKIGIFGCYDPVINSTEFFCKKDTSLKYIVKALKESGLLTHYKDKLAYKLNLKQSAQEHRRNSSFILVKQENLKNGKCKQVSYHFIDISNILDNFPKQITSFTLKQSAEVLSETTYNYQCKQENNERKRRMNKENSLKKRKLAQEFTQFNTTFLGSSSCNVHPINNTSNVQDSSITIMPEAELQSEENISLPANVPQTDILAKALAAAAVIPEDYADGDNDQDGEGSSPKIIAEKIDTCLLRGGASCNYANESKTNQQHFHNVESFAKNYNRSLATYAEETGSDCLKVIHKGDVGDQGLLLKANFDGFWTKKSNKEWYQKSDCEVFSIEDFNSW